MTNRQLKSYVSEQIATYYEEGREHLHSFYDDVNNAFKSTNGNTIDLVLFDKEHFMKSFGSLVDSICRRMNSFAGDISVLSINSQELVNKLNDALDNYKDFFRINIRVNNDSLFQTETISALKTIRKIKNISLHYDNVDKDYKNSFKESSDCKDFKVYFKYKEKYPFEIQFHNTSSEKMNLATHGIYEVYRAEDLKLDYKKKLGNDRKTLYKMVVPPKFDERVIIKEGLES